MIKRLRWKLIVACMASLTAVLVVILGGVNLMSYQKVVSDADAVLALLDANGGAFPKSYSEQGGRPPWDVPPGSAPAGQQDLFGQRSISPETPYESRFFSVLLGVTGQVIQVDTGQIAAVNDQEAVAYARNVSVSGQSSGFWNDYRYLVCVEEQGSLIIFLDCSRSLSAFRTTLIASVLLALLGLLAVLILLLILSGRIVRPVAESYEKQKRFITDAGHELKTPLTIISADADLAEMECGENQWLSDIRHQAQRLTGLTNDLIYLSRMEEEQPQFQHIDFPLSDMIEEMAQSFQALAKSQEKEVALHIEPMLSYVGDEKAIRQLLSILLDNALKYSPAGGQLELRLEKQGRTILLSVSNPCSQPVERNKLAHLFDRFYRIDQSRSSQTGGYGLGLSIAKSIVLAHKGKIRAESADGHWLTIVIQLPL
nr:HAMP domain-containing sensor histidine kinase [uncultured Agathobaculum sp.]